MIVTITVKWSRRTKPLAGTAPARSPQTLEEWVYTRGLILRVLNNFPETLQAVRDAMREYRERVGPKPLDPGPAP